MPSFTQVTNIDTFTTWRIRTNELIDWLNNETADNNYAGGAAPTTSNDSSGGYGPGSVWIDETSNPTEVYRCTDGSVGAAIWLNTSLEIGDLGSIVTQDSNSISITGGTLSGVTLTGITDITVSDGGTGSSTAGGARTNLGISATNTPATSITSGTATNVQGILNELDADSTGLATHIAAISATNTPATSITSGTATNVQGILNELDADSTGLATHIADTTDVHASTSIKFTPFGSITATDVQNAIEELDLSGSAVTNATLNTDTSTGAMAFVVDEDTMSSNSSSKLATQQSIKAYVDAVAASEMSYQGGYNASTNTPDLDTSPSGINKGDVYAITANGTFFSVAVKIGDLIISEILNPAVEADWTILAGGTTYVHPSHPGDDFSLDTGVLSGATVVSDVDINVTTDSLGHVTDANGVVATRTLTLANLGFTGSATANNYTHPSHPGDDFSVDTGVLSGATVVSDVDINVTTDALGHVTDANGVVATRTLTLSNLGYTGSPIANNYSHPSHTARTETGDTGTLSGATVISDLDFNISVDTSGHVTSADITTLATRELTLLDLGYRGETNATADQTKADIDALNINADTLDNVNSSSFLRSDINTIKTAGYQRFNDSIKIELGTGADTDIYHNGNHTYVDQLTGNLYIRDNTTTRFTFARTTGDFTATGNVTAYSDERVKENIEVIPDALAKVSSLSGYTFDRTDIDVPRQTGVIAQEVEKVLPEAVTTNEDGVLSVAYGNMVGLLIESIKELENRIIELENR